MQTNTNSILRYFLLFCFSIMLVACAGNKDERALSEYSADELYARAQESLESQSWLQAVERLQELEAQFPYGKYAQQAQIDTVYAYYKLKDAEQTIAAADRFIRLHPSNEYVDYALYLKGLASFTEDESWFGRLTGRDDLSDRDSQYMREARDAFTQLVERFPNSRYAPDSRARIRHLTNGLANNLLVIANYYYSRGAYVAAVNRGTELLEKFPNTDITETALALNMFSYQRMGLGDLASDTRRILEYNYPKSKYLSMSPDEARFSNWLSEKEAEVGKTGWTSSLVDKYRSWRGKGDE